MISTALLVSAGAEQTSVSSASAGFFPNQKVPAGSSFAKSFAEQVDVPVLPTIDPDASHLAVPDLAGSNLVAPNLQTSNLPEFEATEEQPAGLPGLQNAVPGKRSEEVAETLDNGIDKGTAKKQVARESGLQSELSHASVGKTLQQAPLVAAASQRILTAPTKVKTVKEPPQVEEAEENSLPGATSAAALTTETANEEPGALLEVADAGRALDVSVGAPLVSSGRPVARGEIEAPGEAKETVPAKKAAKAQVTTQVKTADLNSVEKSGAAAVTTAANQLRPVAGHLTAALISAAPGLTAALPNEIGKQVEDFKQDKGNTATARPSVSGVSSDASPAQQTGTAGADAQTKTDGVITATAASAANDPIVSPKSGASPDKVAATEAPTSSASSESKTQDVSGPAAQLVHAVSGGVEGTVGLLPEGIASGNAQADLSAVKSPAESAVAHTPGSLSGLKEQDGGAEAAHPIEATPRLLAATPTSLEVGIPNGTHGWLRVRAEIGEGGGVNASVSAASPAGQELLHRELPALTAYLQQEKVAVSAIVVHTPAAADVRGTSGYSGSSAYSGTGNTGAETSQRSSEGGEQGRYADGKAPANGTDAIVSPVLQGVGEDGSLPLGPYAVGGGWLSVRA